MSDDKDDAPKSTVIQLSITPLGLAVLVAGVGVVYWAFEAGGVWHMLGVVGMWWLTAKAAASAVQHSLSSSFKQFADDASAELNKLANANRVLVKQAEELKRKVDVLRSTHEQAEHTGSNGSKPE